MMEFYKIENDFIKIDLNPKLYNLETIYSAAYQLMENAYVYLEGDPDIEITVNLSFKDKSKNTEDKLSDLAKEFLNHLVNYTFYKINSKKKEALRALLLKKSFDYVNLDDYDEEECQDDGSNKEDSSDDTKQDLTAEEESVFEDAQDEDKKTEEDLDEEDFEFDDPEGIAIPWEEKYGKEEEKDGD